MAGTKITQLQESATPGRRFGTFSGKVPSSGRTVGKLTQLQLSATPGRRYGTFSGRGSSAGTFWIFGDFVLQ